MLKRYPRTIPFGCCQEKGLTPDALQWLRRVKEEVRITMPADDTIVIEYPTDIIRQVRTVNVDDSIFRLDLKDTHDRFFICNAIFPDVPWNNRGFMTRRWHLGRRTDTPGKVSITYPDA